MQRNTISKKGPRLTPDAPCQPAGNRPAGPRHGDLCVLVVDDNYDLADAMSLLLESMGHEIQVAHDGIQALDAASAFKPHVVVLDIGMFRLNGIETAKRLRATPDGPGITLIALSAWDQATDRQRTTNAGLDHHLAKPADPEVLEQLLAEVAI